MEAALKIVTQNWTPGGAGIWVLVFMVLGAWWKGLPRVLEAFANRQSKVEERMGQLLEDATARFSREIAAADQRHDECIKGQQELVNEVRRLRACVTEQQETIDQMRRKFASLQVATIRTEGMRPSPMVEAAMRSIDEIDGRAE